MTKPFPSLIYVVLRDGGFVTGSQSLINLNVIGGQMVGIYELRSTNKVIISTVLSEIEDEED